MSSTNPTAAADQGLDRILELELAQVLGERSRVDPDS